LGTAITLPYDRSESGLSTPTMPASPSVCRHWPSSQLFPQGLPSEMANRQDRHLILADRERATYERWLRWAWAGPVRRVLAGLRAGCTRLGPPPKSCSHDDPRKVSADASGSVENDRYRKDYPGCRSLGLTIRSAAVKSLIKLMNRRRKGMGHLWEGGAEAVLQVRATYVNEDGRAERYCSRPHPQAGGTGRPPRDLHLQERDCTPRRVCGAEPPFSCLGEVATSRHESPVSTAGCCRGGG
jgi:hypothetical protein